MINNWAFRVFLHGLGETGQSVWSSAHVKCHPRDGLILWDRGTLDQLELESLVIKSKGKDGTRRRPGADHEMVNGHRGISWGVGQQLFYCCYWASPDSIQ